MYNKSIHEVKSILEKFPEFSDVGYVVTPVILQVGADLHLPFYAEAYLEWIKTNSLDQKHFAEGEILPDTLKLITTWEGSALSVDNGCYHLGLKAAVAQIYEVLKNNNLLEQGS